MKKFMMVFGVILVLLVACASFVFYYVWSAKEVPLSAEDKTLLVSPYDLIEYFEGFDVDEEAISMSKKKYADGAEELTLEYQSTGEGQPYLSVSVDREIAVKDTAFGYKAIWHGFTIGLNLGDRNFEVKEVTDFIALGDESRFGIVYYENKQVGNVFVIRAGANIYSLIMLGFYFDEAELFNDVLAERIAVLQGSSIKKL